MSDPEWVTKAEASRRSAEFTSNQEPVPESTIRSWTKPTSTRKALLATNGHKWVHWPTVKKLAAEFQPRAKPPKAEAVKMSARVFAEKLGVSVQTVYDWKKRSVISDYTVAEADRMMLARVVRDKGGPGLEQQAKRKRAREEAEELGIEVDETDEISAGALRAVRHDRERMELRKAMGELYEANDVHSVLEAIVGNYRDALNRGALQVRRAVQATLDQHAVQLPPVALDELNATVSDILAARAVDIRQALEEQRAQRKNSRRG